MRANLLANATDSSLTVARSLPTFDDPFCGNSSLGRWCTAVYQLGRQRAFALASIVRLLPLCTLSRTKGLKSRWCRLACRDRISSPSPQASWGWAAQLRFEPRPSWAACGLTLLMAMLAATCAVRQDGARHACGVSPKSIPVGRSYRMNRWRKQWHTMFDLFRKDTIRLRRT